MKKEDLSKRDFLKLADFTPDEILYFIEKAADFKERLKRHESHQVFLGYTAAMVFEKPSTRTRTSFQVACAHLGIQSFYMRPDEMQLSRGEPIKDTARVIDRYCDLLFIRTFGQQIVEEFAKYMKKPVINALTDQYHPCQGLADLLTIREYKGIFKGLKVAYVGDVWNVCHSLMCASAMTGMDFYLAYPEGYEPYPEALKNARRFASDSGAKIVLTHTLQEAVEGADVVVANTWFSMGGPEKTKEERKNDFNPFRITLEVMSWARNDAIFMHCMPAYRGNEMTEDVIEGPQSVVFDEAENRLHTEKAVVYLLLNQE